MSSILPRFPLITNFFNYTFIFQFQFTPNTSLAKNTTDRIARVMKLKKLRVGKHLREEKLTSESLELVMLGRPTPFLERYKKLTDPNSPNNIYKQYNWITANNRTQLFYCWPCLFFKNGMGLWTFWGSLGTYICYKAEDHDKRTRHVLSVARFEEYCRRNVWRLPDYM